MQKDFTVFKIPNFKRQNAYDFDTVKVEKSTKFTLYDELNQIAEELEKCRLENS